MINDVMAAKELRRIIDNSAGDDLYRANMEFGHMSEPALDQQYGRSGQTCRQIWQAYKDSNEKYKAAKNLLNRLLATESL